MASNLFFCRYPLSPLRLDSTDSSEIVSQVVFGEIVEKKNQENQWVLVSTTKDYYEGWMDEKFLIPITEKEARRWQDTHDYAFDSLTTLSTPWGEEKVPMGSFLPYDIEENEFQIGNHPFEVLSERTRLPFDLNELIQPLIGTPYLWGGKTNFGIDCSGLTQLLLRFQGKNIPRDAYQQEEGGFEVDWEDKELGDLVFFINEKERIHHVGLLLSEDQIIHAHGCVRIDKLTKEGILSAETNNYTHKFHSIRRM
ncbi:MAG: NlpC/P60 family protein [Crocinitomicaceae bacterium]|nr:NlpC/P60 family protein [Crocinitomicaceae bacterium]